MLTYPHYDCHCNVAVKNSDDDKLIIHGMEVMRWFCHETPGPVSDVQVFCSALQHRLESRGRMPRSLSTEMILRKMHVELVRHFKLLGSKRCRFWGRTPGIWGAIRIAQCFKSSIIPMYWSKRPVQGKGPGPKGVFKQFNYLQIGDIPK